MIKIGSLHKFFNKGRQNEIHVINNVNLELPQKGMVAIFGKSGCGKTTLLNVIGGLDKFHSGNIEVKGEKITKNPDDIRNKNMGYIFQNYNLNKEETCFENVANALYLCGITDKSVVEARVMAALKNVDMDKYSKRTPDTLSGGQQQRIAIARAIVKNPPIILADEPTGNLDEANTIMIMDLLKEISREHLVLLVTHEANLVDFYCDTVIELSDGKVINVKNNNNADGYSGRDKNAIYLGEFEKNNISDEKLEVEYYGESPASPIKLKVINNGGKLYLKVESEGVSLIDQSSEIKLKEGVFEDKKGDKEQNSFSMSALPSIHGTRFGKIFDFKRSLKSGYVSVSQKQKKSKKLLRRCMSLFAAVLVFMSALFGTSFKEIFDIRDSYNHNVFYVKTSDGEISKKLNESVGDENSGIDYVKLFYTYPNGDANFAFYTGSFETYQTNMFSEGLKTKAVLLGSSLAENLPLVVGKKTDLSDTEAVITTKVADALLEESPLGYIKEYKDLIGLIAKGLSIGGKSVRISGVVESDETAVYLSDRAIAYYMNSRSMLSVSVASDKGMTVSEGEGILVANRVSDSVVLPAVGDTVKIYGRDIKIAKIYSSKEYDEWISDEGIKKKNQEEYFRDLMAEAYPDLTENTEEYSSASEKLYSEKYADFLEYYYSEYDAYLKYLYIASPSDFNIWMYVEKDIDFAISQINVEFYAVVKLKKANGTSPTLKQIKEYSENEKDNDEYWAYREEFYASDSSGKGFDTLYLVSEKDYIAFSKQIGETHPTAKSAYSGYYDKEFDYDYDGKYDVEIEYAVETVEMVEVETSNSFGVCYTVIHSNNPSLTERWISSTFPDLEADENDKTNIFEEKPSIILTPDKIFDNLMFDKKMGIITNLISMGAFIVLMSVTMYFIMHSALMSKIKEVGIYRAIGVSKKNLIYRFLIESVVLSSFTVLKGFVFASGFIYACFFISSIMESIFFYPLWYALLIGLFLYAICALFGIIPIALLLRKTPSEILAKYDI